jgi:Mrp family chromosome partitioning ATPase
MYAFMKARTKEKQWRWPATFLFFLIIASLIAIKVNYFTDPRYKTTSAVKTREILFENKPTSASLWNLAVPSRDLNPELVNLLSQIVQEHGWNVEFFSPHPLGKKMISHWLPFRTDYTIKSKTFTHEEFEVLLTDRNVFIVAYEFGGIKRIRTLKPSQRIQEIEISLSFLLNEDARASLPVAARSYVNRPVLVSIHSPTAYAEKLLRQNVTIKHDSKGHLLISVHHPDAQKAMQIANVLAERMAQYEFQSIHRPIDEGLSELTRSGIIPAYYPTEGKAMNEVRSQERIALMTRRNELQLQLKALDNLHDYLRQNRIDGDAAVAFGVLNDPVFANYITTLNLKIHHHRQATDETEKIRLNDEIEFLKNTLAEGLRNTRKTVALQIEELNHQIETLGGLQDVSQAENSMSYIQAQLTARRFDQLLEQKAAASQMAQVIPAPLPLSASNPPPVAVWMIALGSACFAFLLLKKLLSNKPSIHLTLPGQSPVVPLFAQLDKNPIVRNNQLQIWLHEMLIMAHENDKPFIATLTHASNNSASFSAFQLGHMACQEGIKILVIDTTLTKEQMEKLTGTTVEHTLSDTLVEGQPMSDSITALSSGLNILCLDRSRHEFHPVFLINKLQELTEQLNDYRLILLAAPSASNPLTLHLLRMGHVAFLIHTAGERKQEMLLRWKNLFGLQHVYEVEDQMVHTLTKWNSRTWQTRKIRSLMPAEDNSKPGWLRKVALWFY